MVETADKIESAVEFMTLHEMAKLAHIKLSSGVWDYLTGGSESETTLRRNRLAIDSLALRPRVLRDVSKIDCSGSFFGKKTRLPVILAPVGGLESFDPGAAASVARGAGQFGVPVFVSSVSEPGLEATAASSSGRKIFQLYVRGDVAWVDDFVRRAVDAGYEALCLTVDTAIYSRRERDIAKRYSPAGRRRAHGREFQAALNWNDVKRLKDKFSIPIILKGIATAEDAETALGHGVEGIYVSNHGGRQLDQGRGSLDVLPEVVKAVAGRAQVIVDGSFCRGTDILKAIILGADAVGIGRLYCYGLASAGAAGVLRVLELLEAEITTALGLLGVTKPGALDKSYLHPAPVVTVPHVLSAFPLLNLEDEGYGGR